MRQNGGNVPPLDWEPTLAFPPNTGSFIKWGLVLLGVVFLLVLFNTLRGVYTDWLWFNSLGFLDVYRTILWTRAWLFVTGALVFGVMIAVSVVLAQRRARGESVLPLPTETIYWLNRLTILAIVLGATLASLAFGSSLGGQWELALRLINSSSFGVSDPVFQNDVSFYVFSLPILNLVQSWLLGAFIVLLLATAGVYIAYFALRGIPFQLTPWQRGHLAVLGSLVFFNLAFKHILDRYQVLFSGDGAVFGATYADINARLPVLLVMAAIAVASGVLLLATLHPSLRGARGNRLIIGGVVLWLVAAVGLGSLYPSFIQRFTVEPNELQRERGFIARNIEFTRAAFGLDRIEERSYEATAQLTSSDILANQETVNNVRLWDPRPLIDIYNQIQHLRLYYNFQDTDVDRYEINGEYRQVLIGARELYPEFLPEEAQRWVNQRLQFTHGYGAAASPVTEFTDEGRPLFFVQDVPPTGDIEINRPEVYYGENTNSYVIVNSETPEFDHPTEEDVPVYVQYQGSGGVHLSSLLRRIAYAWQFGDINIVISGEILPQSKVLYNRHIQERISHVAPFLELDADPYLIVEQGRLVWMQDAYTMTDKYPYSRPFDERFNYIRNSVKVVVDAYNGQMQFYIADPQDPLIQTYAKIFPALFKPMDDMSLFLRDHLRYPEDLFSVQSETYLQYHMTDPTVFFNKEDQWSVPLEVFFGSQQAVEPYYVIMKLPGEEDVEFVLILPFTPAEKPNMVAWLSARMDGPEYGKLIAYTFPRGVQIDGPVQIEARIDNDTEISQQFTLWNQSGSVVIRGNLLVIPIADSILYVEPVYLRAEGLPLPELKRVILASANKVVMEPSLDEALGALFGGQAVAGPSPPSGGGGTPITLSEEAARQLEAIQRALQDLREGIITLEEAVSQLSDLVQEEQSL